MIEFSALALVCIGGGFTLLGALIGFCASIYSARLAVERQHLYAESAKFRAAFVDEIVDLRRSDRDAFKVLSDDVLSKHRQAKVLFEPWVERVRSSAFDQAWLDYESAVRTEAPGNVNNRKGDCATSLRDIEELLLFARHRG